MSKKDKKATIKTDSDALIALLPRFELDNWERRENDRGKEVLYIRLRGVTVPVKLAVA